MQTIQSDEKLPDDTLARAKWKASSRSDFFEHIEIPSQGFHDDASVPDVILSAMIETFEKATEMTKPWRVLLTLPFDHTVYGYHFLALALVDLPGRFGGQNFQGHKSLQSVSADTM